MPSGTDLLASLDDPATFARNDPEGLLGRIESLPDQCEDGWRHAAALTLPEAYRAAREVVIVGMGGSAIAADMLRSLASSSSAKPVHVVRGYHTPAFVGAQSLVIACSHSGNTEETLSAFEQALSAGAMGLVMTTGGRLAEIAEQRGLPLVRYEYAGEPRSALGHQLMALLAIGERAALLDAQERSVREAIDCMQAQRSQLGASVASSENAAKRLAVRLHGRLTVVVGAGVLLEAAHRWKTQLNENGKCWAVWEELPELDHNTIEGFGLAEEVVPRLYVVFLYHEALGRHMRLRYDATADEMTAAGVSNELVEVGGSAPLAQLMSAVYLGDLVSYYLGMLNGIDPSPVPAITRLKTRLAGG